MHNTRSVHRMLKLALAAAACQIGACTRDEAHRDIPPAQVKTVTAYGLTLDEHATPQQVVYVFLRSIADDVKASQAHPPDKQKQKEAVRTTHALVAYSVVSQRLLETENLARKVRKDTLGEERDERLWEFARQLAPIVSHYVAGFSDDFDAQVSRMTLHGNLETGPAHVHYTAVHNPEASDPQKRDAVILDIELVREPADGKRFWRVARVSYLGRAGITTSTRQSVPRDVANALQRSSTSSAPGP